MGMTERTFTAYQDDSLNNKYSTYLIEESTLFRIKGKDCCFKIKNNVQEDLFCTMKSENDNCDFVQEWDYDYNLFKHQCFKPRPKSTQILETKKLAADFNNRVENLKLDIIKERSINLKKKSNLEEKKKKKKKKTKFKKKKKKKKKKK